MESCSGPSADHRAGSRRPNIPGGSIASDSRAKAILVRGVEDRVGRIGAEMFRRIDAGEFDGSNVMSDALAGVTTLRDRIQRLPTWPWPPQLLRGFVSSLVLPLVIRPLSRPS